MAIQKIVHGQTTTAGVQQTLIQIIDYGLGNGQGAGLNWSTATSRLNQVADTMGLPGLTHGDGETAARSRINAIIDALGIPVDADLYLDFVNRRYFSPHVFNFSRASQGTVSVIDGSMVLAGSNEARFPVDIPSGESRGILWEKGRTNLNTWSGDQMSGVYSDYDGATHVATTEPGLLGGGETFTKVIENNDVGLGQTPRLGRSLAASLFPAGSSVWFSAFVKAAERNSANIANYNFASWVVRTSMDVDLTNGQIISLGGAGGAPLGFVEDWGDGVYRCYIRGIKAESNTPQWAVAPRGVTHDGVSGILTWGWQVELGDWPSTYIPATSSQVDRADDVFNLPVETADVRGFAIDFDLIEPSAGAYGRYLFEYTDGTNNNRIAFRLGSPGTVVVSTVTNGSFSTYSASIGPLPQGRQVLFGVLSDGYIRLGHNTSDGVIISEPIPSGISEFRTPTVAGKFDMSVYRFAEIQGETDAAMAYQKIKTMAQEWL